LGLNAIYVPFRVEEPFLGNAVRGLRDLGVKGFNVTLPHKVKVIQYIDKLDPAEDSIGSINTVINNGGFLYGRNTDGLGALGALEEASVPLKGKSVLMFGAGGAARAIAHALAPKIDVLTIVNRTLQKAKVLARSLQGEFDIEVRSYTFTRLLKDQCGQADLVINASSMGMEGKPDLPVGEQWFRSDQYVFDIVYRPIETRLLRLARLAEAKTVNGLDMLLHQGACSFELWTGREAPLFEMREALKKISMAVADAADS